MEKKRGQQQKQRIVKFKLWKLNFGKDKIRNTVIGDELQVEEIKNSIEMNKLKWYGQVMCMSAKKYHKDAPDKTKKEKTKRNAQNQSRPRWSSGYQTRLWIRGSRVPSRLGSMDFFRA